MSDLSGAAASSFPQVSGCRTLSEMETELAEYTGGSSRGGRLSRARSCIKRAIRWYNRVPWRFNRETENIALASPASGNNKYSLDASFRNAYMAMLVDSDGNDRRMVEWVSYKPFNRLYESKTSTVSAPSDYTARSIFREGEVLVGPGLNTSNLTYPTMRLEFHSRIDHPVNDKDCIEVPEEVEEGIFSLALYLFLMKDRSPRTVESYKKFHDFLYFNLEQQYRDSEDFGAWGGDE